MVTANPLKNTREQVISVARSGSCALLIDAAGAILDQSVSAAPLVALWNSGNIELQRAVESARANRVPSEYHIENEKGVKVWLTVVQQDENTLLMARDTELVEKMAEALLESRVLLKTLLDNAVDLSFEVGLDGRFRFISPADAFGLQTDGWIGKNAAKIFWGSGRVPARSPFNVKKKTQFDSVQVDFGDGEKRHLAVIAEPSHDKGGNISGVRGTCRDITARIEKENATKQDHLRVAVHQRITRILNASENAQELLESASRELIDVLRADLVWSVVKYKDGLVPVALCGDNAEILDLESIWRELAMSSLGVHEFKGETRNHLALRLERGGNGVGMVVISRDTQVSPWSQQEIQLLDDIGDVLTAAFGKAELIDRLYRLSGKDELTDLLNRRAFKEVVERRLKHQCRTGHTGCLVFIDLDHFKEVNDTLGHKAGDKAIILVGDKMQNIIRASDYAGRFGGDEFVLWLEDADEDTAAAKARQLIDYMPEVREKIGNSDLKLGASIGICKSIAGKDLKLEGLADKADAALYEVKKAGKNDIAFASNESEQHGEDDDAQ
jgi:diguanylate cyclase (GGDEF)-like protein/PAS domain S-box-containing protein